MTAICITAPPRSLHFLPDGMQLPSVHGTGSRVLPPWLCHSVRSEGPQHRLRRPSEEIEIEERRPGGEQRSIPVFITSLEGCLLLGWLSITDVLGGARERQKGSKRKRRGKERKKECRGASYCWFDTFAMRVSRKGLGLNHQRSLEGISFHSLAMLSVCTRRSA